MADLNAILKNKMGLSVEQAKKSKILASLSGSDMPISNGTATLQAIGQATRHQTATRISGEPATTRKTLPPCCSLLRIYRQLSYL